MQKRQGGRWPGSTPTTIIAQLRSVLAWASAMWPRVTMVVGGAWRGGRRSIADEEKQQGPQQQAERDGDLPVIVSPSTSTLSSKVISSKDQMFFSGVLPGGTEDGQPMAPARLVLGQG